MRGRKYPVTLPYREIADSSRYAAGLKAMPADLKKLTATATRTLSWFLKTFYRKRGKADKRCVQSDITALFITAAKRRVTGCFYFFRLGAFFCRLAALTRLGASTENASTARHCSRIPYDNVPVYLRGNCFCRMRSTTHTGITRNKTNRSKVCGTDRPNSRAGDCFCRMLPTRINSFLKNENVLNPENHV